MKHTRNNGIKQSYKQETNKTDKVINNVVEISQFLQIHNNYRNGNFDFKFSENPRCGHPKSLVMVMGR